MPSSTQQPPSTLPADFSGWDAAPAPVTGMKGGDGPPQSLPADFNEWDGTPTPSLFHMNVQSKIPDEATARTFALNNPHAKQGDYTTRLKPEEEKQFQQWVAKNKIPWQDTPTADYDMRGYYRAMVSGDPNAKQAANRHFPDTWKTPYHKSFSNESRYALPTAPKWNDKDQLVDQNGQVVFDEKNPTGPPATLPADHKAWDLKQPQGTLRAYHPSAWQNLKRSFGETEVGNIVESNLDQLSGMLKRTDALMSNPGAMTNEEWEQRKKEQTDFFERHLGKGVLAGGAAGAAEFGEDMTSPYQMLLMAGTLGESGMVQAAERIGIKGMVPAARTLAKLVQVGFTAQMIEGAEQGGENAVKAAMNGDWEGAGKAAIEGLASAYMAKQGVTHEMASERVARDLTAVAQEQHGKSFNDLDPFTQGLVIDETVKRSPAYQDVLKTADEQQEKGKDETRKKQRKRLNQYYATAVNHAWQPEAAQRAIDGLQQAREEDARHQSIRDVVATIRAGAEQRAKALTEAQETARQAGREERPERRQRTAAERAERQKVAAEIRDKRQEVFAQREEAQQAPSDIAQREVEAVHDEQGGVKYPANYWGEENSFGATADVMGHGVYRETPRGYEWLDGNGNFSEAPDNVYTTNDPHTADTIARLSSLSATADTLADAEGATEAQKQDAEYLASIRRDLVAGDIDTKEAQRRAGIAEKVKLSDEFTAARDGQLTGPFHESSAKEFQEKLESSMRNAGDSGWEEEDIRAVMDQSMLLARQQTESNLHHVSRPGDMIVSKRGVRWTLDSRGMLHPDDGGPAVPLIRDGMYSNQAIQLAESGRVGYGTQTREQRRLAAAKRRDVEEAIRRDQEEVSTQVRLAAQREGLQTATAVDPRADVTEKQMRERRRMSRPPRAPETPESQIVRMIFQAPSDANSIINSIARAKEVSPEEVMRLSLATDPAMSGTPEQKVAGLEPGDRIVEPIRKKPWVVEVRRNGDTYLRSGNAQPLKLDRLNPSEAVKGIIARGEIEKDQAPGDAEKVAFENPHYVRWQDEMVAQVEDLVKKPAPKPVTPKQAEMQVKATQRRADAAVSVATKKTVEAVLEPKTDSVEQAEKQVEEAQQLVKTAEEAYAQAVEAQVDTEPKEVFPQKASVSIGLKGRDASVVQNGREVPIRYELVPIDALTTSHEWRGKQMVENPQFPTSLQPRTISDDEAAQNALRAERGTYDFREYADQTINGSMGPAIVDEGGQVVGGNTRIAIMRKHLSLLESTPDVEEREAVLAGMKARMRQLARDSGIERYPEDGKMYVVVRMMKEPIKSTREAAELGRLFNKKIGVEIGKSAKGVSYAKSLDDKVLSEIGRLVDAHDSLAAAITAEPDFFNKIVEDRFDVGPEEYANWFRTVGNDQIKQRILSEEGRSQFAKALLGTVIRDGSILNRLEGKTPFLAVERALGYLIKLRGLPHLDITPKVVEAMRAAADTDGVEAGLSRHGDRWHATYSPDQVDAFAMMGMEGTVIPPEPDRMTEVLWRALHAGNRTLNDRLKSYIGEESAGAMSMFEAKAETPVEAFNRTFRKEFSGAEHLRKDGLKELTADQFQAALENRDLSNQGTDSEEKGGSGDQPEPAGGGLASPLNAKELLDDLESNPRMPNPEEEAVLAEYVLNGGREPEPSVVNAKPETPASDKKLEARLKQLKSAIAAGESHIEDLRNNILEVMSHIDQSAKGGIDANWIQGLNQLGGTDVETFGDNEPGFEWKDDGKYPEGIIQQLQENVEGDRKEIAEVRAAIEAAQREHDTLLGNDRYRRRIAAWDKDSPKLSREERAIYREIGAWDREAWAKVNLDDDAAVLAAVGKHLGIAGGSTGGEHRAAIDYKGGKDPKIWIDAKSTHKTKPTYEKKALANMARNIIRKIGGEAGPKKRGMTRPDKAPELTAQATLPEGVTVYSSGANSLADMTGHFKANMPIGVSVPELTTTSLKKLMEYAKDGHPIFVDSGAFSEVGFGPEGVTVKKPITDEEWNKRLGNYLKIARAAHEAETPNVTFVAPDMVGSQDVTLQRLAKFKTSIEDLLNLDSQVLIPLQNGVRSPVDFFNEARGIFAGAYNEEKLIPAFPMNKAAADAEKVTTFLAAVPGIQRVHLLGTSMADATTRKLVTAIRDLYPDVKVTLDANRLRAKTGEIVDRAREAREELLADAKGQTQGRDRKRDFTEEVFTPGQWANKAALERIADNLAAIDPEFDRKSFLEQPDIYLANSEGNDWMQQVLTDEYLKSVGKDVASVARARAVEAAMESEKPAAPAKMTRPEAKPSTAEAATKRLGQEKTEKGFVTPDELKTFLESHPSTKDHAPELLRTAKLMSEYVFDTDPPIGVDRKDALGWVLRERLAGIEGGELKSARGQYSDPNIEKGFGDGIMRLHKAADPSTFIHEFAHVIFPLLSDEDMKAIATIKGTRGLAEWDGQRGTLRGEVYAGMSERLAHGMEQFLRDENPTGFTHEVKAVLAKVKDIMRKVYLAFKGDPLSDFANTEESREVFAKMFGIADFDVADDWREEVKKARADEKRLKRPSEEKHPLVKIASDMGAEDIKSAVTGKVSDTIGERIDPRKPSAVLLFKDKESGMAAWSALPTPKIPSAELVESEEGKWGIRFNTKTKVPPDILEQGLPEKHPGLELEDMEKRLKETPTFKVMERKLLQLRIDNLKNRIRAEHGAEELAPKQEPGLANAVAEEVKNGRTDGVRKAADGISRNPQSSGAPKIPKPRVMGMPGHAGARGKGGGAAGEPVARVTSLADVKPVNLLPLANLRGTPVGTVKDQAFDSRKWTDSLKAAGLPENAPAPSYALDPKVAQVLKYPGQKEIVQLAMSALEQGDGFVVASATGTGKTYTAMATAREFRNLRPDAKILHITKNRGLLKDAAKVAANFFGMEVEKDVPDSPEIEPGVYGTTHIGNLNNKIYGKIKWDLVLTDESGELRNWFRDENKVGKAGIETTNNAEKVVWFSATPFHSPNEYGYLNKLNLWPKGQFDKWIQENFAHEKVGDKIVARLDPSKQAKLRQQLIERGQLVSQSISYEGFNAHFGVVPVTDTMKRSLDRIREGFARARDQFVRMGKKGMAEKVSAFEATYTKAFLERERIPQAIELIRKARRQGWRVMVFSETSAEDLFRRPREDGEDPSTYQMLDDAMGGTLSKIIPPFEDVYDRLREEFGSEIVDYSGRGNTMASRDAAKLDFLTGKAPMLYTTYAAGGIGVSLHDADYPDLNITGGDKPRVAIYLGPPYSGVLLEQAMGRPWRFGVKSDVHAVFLATDSEPDIHLMQTKIGPRMRALRAAVHGEQDSLASVMQSYTDEQKVRERQDMLAYAEGDEMKVNATNFTVRSKNRDVGINDWSQIHFPAASEAMNKGMRYGQDVAGGDWSNLFQAKFGMHFPDSPEDIAAKKTIDSMANAAVSGKDPAVAKLEPADRDTATALAVADATAEVDIKADRDKSNTAKQAMEAHLKQGAFIPYHGITLTQEQGMVNIASLDGHPDVGYELRRMNRGYRAEWDSTLAQSWNLLEDSLKRNKLKPEDKVMRQLWDIVEGKTVSDDPAVMALAADVSDMMALVHDDLAKAGVKVKTKNGQQIPYTDFPRDPNYMPHRIDWEYEMTDPDTGEKVKVKDFLKVDEKRQQRILDSIPELRAYSRKQILDYLRRNDPKAPAQTNIHYAREVNFPFIKKDYSTLLSYFDSAAQAVAAAKNFGPESEKLNNQIDRIKNVRGNATLKSMFRAALTPQDWTGVSGKIYNAAVAYEAASKMTFSAFKVPFHLVLGPVALKGRVMPHIKAFARLAFHPIEVRENATYVGTVVRQSGASEMLFGERMNAPVRQILRREMFESAYRMVRIVSGEAGRVYLDQYAMRDLKKGGTRAEHTRRMLKDVFLIGDHGIDEAIKNGQFNQEDMAKAQTAFTNLAAFSGSGDPIQMPQMARLEMSVTDPWALSGVKRAVRLTYALQSFSVKAVSLLREHLWDEVMVHGNKKPLMYAMIAFPIVGSMLNLTGTGAKNVVQVGLEKAFKKKHKEDSWDRYIAQLEDTFEHPGAVKFLKWYIDSWALSAGLEMLKTLADPLLNLAAGKPAKADPYWLGDAMEHIVGSFFTDVYKTGEEVVNLQKIHGGKKHPEQKPSKIRRSLLGYATEEVPALREIPWVNEHLQRPKKMRATSVQHEDVHAEIPPILQKIAASLNVHTVPGKEYSGYGGEKAIASVDANDPSGRVEINDPSRFAQGPKQIMGHEIYHVWRRNLPGQTQKMAMPNNENNPYDISHADELRRRGHTMADIPEEVGGEIIQTYIARPEMRRQLQPWIDDMEKQGMSLVQATDPNATQINTTPRTPMAPF